MNIETKVIHVAIRRSDGTVSVMAYVVLGRGNVLPKGAAWYPDPEKPSGAWTRRATDDLIEEECLKAIKSTPWHGAMLGWRIIKESDVPGDRAYRNAWTDDGKKITHDMPKARELHRGHIRKHRAAAFRDLDGQWMRAVGQGNAAEADRIEKERQRLRDAPADPRIEAAQTAADLMVLPMGTE